MRAWVSDTGFIAWHAALFIAATVVPLAACAVAIGTLLDADVAAEMSRAAQTWLAAGPPTLTVALVAGGVATLLAVVYGTCLARVDLPLRPLLAACTLVLATVPIYLFVVFVFALVSNARFAGSAVTAGALYGCFFAPLAALLVAGALRSLPAELEAPALLETGPWRVFGALTLPCARPALLAIGLFVALLSATDYTITNLLIVPTYTETLLQSFQLRPQSAQPWLNSVPLIVFVAACWALLLRAARASAARMELGGATPRPLPIKRRALAWGVLVALFLPAALWYGCSTRGIIGRLVVAQSSYREVLMLLENWGRTYWQSSLATVVILPTALALAWGAVRSRRIAWCVGIGCAVLLVFPPQLVGVLVVNVLNHADWRGALYDHPDITVAGYLVRFLPLAVLLLVPVFARLPLEVEQAAQLDGAGLVRRFRSIVLPAASPAAALAALVVLVLCVGELPTTYTLTRPGYETAAVRAFTLVHFGVYGQLAILALLCSGGTLLTAGLALICWRWYTRRRVLD